MRTRPRWSRWAFVVVGVFALALPVASAELEEERDAGLRIMTWNIHHGVGADGKLDLTRLAAVIRAARVDLVGLQEVDRGVQRTGRRDLAGELAALTGMSCVFSNNFHFQGGEYGNAILSRLRIVEWRNRHYRMLREGEQRGLLGATVEWRGSRLRLFVTHLDYRPAAGERLAHVAEIRQEVAGRAEPVMVVGDFNDFAGGEVYRALSGFLEDAWVMAGEGAGSTYPSGNPDRRIDYIFLDPEGPWRVRKAEVIATDGSDHLPVVIELEW